MARPVKIQLADLQAVVLELRRVLCQLNGVVSALVEGGPLERPLWLDEVEAIAERLQATRKLL